MGIQKDLKISDYQYYNCLTLFCNPKSYLWSLPQLADLGSPDIGYVLFLLPANILLRRFPPHNLIGIAVMIFGGLHTAMSASPNYQTILAIRVLIGAAQAFIQGLGIYIGLWYKRDEYATRAGQLAPKVIFHWISFIRYHCLPPIQLSTIRRQPSQAHLVV